MDKHLAGLYSLIHTYGVELRRIHGFFWTHLYFTTPDKSESSLSTIYPIDSGVIEHWENEVEGLKNDPDSLNEYYRQFPRTEQHAFRDEAKA